MRIQELVEAVPVGSSTQPVANTNVPPQQPGTPPPKPIPGQPAPAPGQPQPNQQKLVQPPQQSGNPQTPSLGNQNPTGAAAPAKPSPEVQQDMQAMSDQFNALKLKYDELQKQILNPAAQV